jgi:ankyrin repeat protein
MYEDTGGTLLHVAAMRSLEAVKILLEFGTDVKKKDNEAFTPLHGAVVGGDLETVRLLLERWPQGVKERALCGYTPLDLAALCEKTDIVRLGLEYCPEGASVKKERKMC